MKVKEVAKKKAESTTSNQYQSAVQASLKAFMNKPKHTGYGYVLAEQPKQALKTVKVKKVKAQSLEELVKTITSDGPITSIPPASAGPAPASAIPAPTQVKAPTPAPEPIVIKRSSTVSDDPLMVYLTGISEDHQLQKDMDQITKTFKTFSTGSSENDIDVKKAKFAYESIFNEWEVDLTVAQE